MNENTDVSFKNNSRIHFGISVTDLEKSVAFYRKLFQADPAKVKEDYAKFELDDPSINLALDKTSKEITGNRVTHFGIQLKSSEAVKAETERFKELGLITETEEARTCCYAVQDKVWVTDPDGNKWELFVVTQYQSDLKSDKQTECCSETSAAPKEACCI